jgi:hypothetical protein
MNEKEAREIIKTGQPNEHMFFKAKGYLEAIEKAKKLEEALDGLLMDCDANTNGRESDAWFNSVRDAHKVLDEWEKSK